MFTQFYSYLRVSTLRQGQSGLGLEAQRESVARYIAGIGGTLREEFVEVESGRLNDRPILRRAMAECRRSGSTLVIAKLDRLARNVCFIAGLIEQRVPIVAADMPDADITMLQIYAVMAEREARVIGERTKAALAAAKARGVQLGKNGVNLARANKASALAFAETMAGAVEEITAAGAKTLQDIADGLNNRALATREGARWSPMTASRLLARLRDRGRSADPCSASATLAIPYEDCDSLVAAQSLHV